MTRLMDIENRADIGRVTCGWKKAHLPLDVVFRYWRDVHSPAIARRDGVYDYRHIQFGPIKADLLRPLAGIDLAGEAGAHLQWQSDVRYLNATGLAEFGASPGHAVKAHLLADIDLIVDRSTTYLVLGDNGTTVLDETGQMAPQGVPGSPEFTVFFRAARDQASFRQAISSLADTWSRLAGVSRVRKSLFEVPDMEAERKAGYPIKTHPVEQQYQAKIDLVLERVEVGASLIEDVDILGDAVRAIHAYPVNARYTIVYGGAPTLVGLRGFGAFEAIEALGAVNQRQPDLLAWMYGPIATRQATP